MWMHRSCWSMTLPVAREGEHKVRTYQAVIGPAVITLRAFASLRLGVTNSGSSLAQR